jgi:hypothetical protein
MNKLFMLVGILVGISEVPARAVNVIGAKSMDQCVSAEVTQKIRNLDLDLDVVSISKSLWSYSRFSFAAYNFVAKNEEGKKFSGYITFNKDYSGPIFDHKGDVIAWGCTTDGSAVHYFILKDPNGETIVDRIQDISPTTTY